MKPLYIIPLITTYKNIISYSYSHTENSNVNNHVNNMGGKYVWL